MGERKEPTSWGGLMSEGRAHPKPNACCQVSSQLRAGHEAWAGAADWADESSDAGGGGGGFLRGRGRGVVGWPGGVAGACAAAGGYAAAAGRAGPVVPALWQGRVPAWLVGWRGIAGQFAGQFAGRIAWQPAVAHIYNGDDRAGCEACQVTQVTLHRVSAAGGERWRSLGCSPAGRGRRWALARGVSWPSGLRPCAGWATRPRWRGRMIRAGARAGRRARRGVMSRCRARAARVPCAGPGRRLAGASFMSSGASGGEKEGAGIYGR